MTDAVRAALERIAALHPDTDSSEGMNEWGEAECFSKAQQIADAALAGKAQSEEMSPEFTDTARDALLWVLWHHQGGSSPIGQPIRFALGMGAHDRLSEPQINRAKRWASLTKSTTDDFHRAHPAPVERVALLPSEAWQEAQRNHAEDAYFAPRPVQDGAMSRKAFCDGFDRGWRAALQGEHHD